MRVLVTNDDGIDAPGLAALARHAVEAGHDVFVLAPQEEMSGAGASMGSLALHHPIEVRPRAIPTLDGVPAHAAAATPAACAILGCLGAVGPPPDLVLSGINHGFNVGRSALHSGTVGAALTAAAWGAKGLAVSTAWADDGDVHWETAASVAVDLTGWFMESDDLPTLSVNVPNTPRGGLRGVRWATLAPVGAIRSAIMGIEETGDGDGFRVLTHHRSTDPAAAPQRSDRALVAGGWVTLTGLAGLAELTPNGESAGEPSLDRLLARASRTGEGAGSDPGSDPEG
jgi:5'-nucleotidase